MFKSDSSSDPDLSNKTLSPFKIKSECKKTAEGMEMLAYFQARGCIDKNVQKKIIQS